MIPERDPGPSPDPNDIDLDAPLEDFADRSGPDPAREPEVEPLDDDEPAGEPPPP
jgi:hypothetical protein